MNIITVDYLLADSALREVIGGETGPRTRLHVQHAIEAAHEELSRDPDFDIERHAAECSDHMSGSLFPYSYDMAQAWAESLHHITFAPDLSGIEPEQDTPYGLVVIAMEQIVHAAILRACCQLKVEDSH